MNYRKTITLGAALGLMLCAPSFMQAQTKGGGIDMQMLGAIEKAGTPAAGDRALANAIASNSIDDLAKNFKNAGQVDTYFSVETPKQSIHDQKSSGSCWPISHVSIRTR